ncbi:hypothetical protein C1I92_21540 [Jiangella anatolica]|uniref:LppM domain-containing protein n=1 Tax=Jiangella anatolica TaxID=2670374 RepID=A0A2W2B5K3_9ACTN|nr:hypothetical protein C1I92_21540 [Jiangella anatolica]
MRALVLAASALLLAGCFKVDMELDIAENDTVSGEFVLAISRDASAMAESMGEDPSSMLGEMTDLPEGTETEPYEDDRFVGQRYVFADVPLSEFSQDQEFSIVHEGDEIVLSGNLDLTEMSPEALGSELSEQLGGLGDMDELMESVEMQVAVTFPGEVTEHNGDLDDTTVTWTPVPGEPNEISARSADSGGGSGDSFPVWIWIVVVAVVLGLVALLFFLSRNRNQAPPADTATADTATAGPVPPPPPGREAAPTQPTTPLPPPAPSESDRPDPQPPAPPR